MTVGLMTFNIGAFLWILFCYPLQTTFIEEKYDVHLMPEETMDGLPLLEN